MRRREQEIAGLYSYIQIATASHKKRVVMLHERCLSLVAFAMRGPEEKRRPALDKAQNIIAQLEISLTDDDTVSKSLYCLYDHAYALLEHTDEKPVKKAYEIIKILTDTFKTLLKK